MNHDCCYPIIIYICVNGYHFHAHYGTFWFKIGKIWKDDFNYPLKKKIWLEHRLQNFPTN